MSCLPNISPIPDPEELSESSLLFSAAELALLDLSKVPQHIAIIPDGNRRWAELRTALPQVGHKCGADGLMQIVRAAKELGVRALTVYTFSTENWLRVKEEVEALMFLLEYYLLAQCEPMCRDGVRLSAIGAIDGLPEGVQQALKQTQQATAGCQEIDLILALNYGGRDELCRAMRSLAADCVQGKCNYAQIDEAMLASYLDTSSWADPDLLIRTSSETRLSNFLLWQLSYTEMYFCDILWPDFTPHHLLDAIIYYQQRQRRCGA